MHTGHALGIIFFLCALPPTSLATNVRVFGYVPEYRHSLNWDKVLLSVTDVIFFSLEVSAEGHLVAFDRLPSRELIQKVKTHERKAHVCIGGAGRSSDFAKFVLLTVFVPNVQVILLPGSERGISVGVCSAVIRVDRQVSIRRS